MQTQCGSEGCRDIRRPLAWVFAAQDQRPDLASPDKVKINVGPVRNKEGLNDLHFKGETRPIIRLRLWVERSAFALFWSGLRLALGSPPTASHRQWRSCSDHCNRIITSEWLPPDAGALIPTAWVTPWSVTQNLPKRPCLKILVWCRPAVCNGIL